MEVNNNENINNMMNDEGEGENNNNNNGVKLPYFHRVLSKEDQQLIGDISPKPITESSSTITEPSSTLHMASVWNSAQTYEERNVSNIMLGKIRKILEDFNCISSSSSISMNIEKPEVTGTATIAHMKGKPRYIYDFCFKFNFEINNNYKGSLQIDDVSPDDLDDIHIQIQWTKEPPSFEYSTTKNYINKDFKTLFLKKIKEFEKEFRSI